MTATIRRAHTGKRRLGAPAGDGIGLFRLPRGDADHGAAYRYRETVAALAIRTGCTIAHVHDRVPSRCVRRLDEAWSHVAPGDVRPVASFADPRRVPRPGTGTIVAEVIDAADAARPGVDGGTSTRRGPGKNGHGG